MPTFYKYDDGPTVYQDSDTNAFSSEAQAYSAGVKKDWSNVETRKRSQPQTFTFGGNAAAGIAPSTYGFDAATNTTSPVTTSTSIRSAADNLNTDINAASKKSPDLASLLELFGQSNSKVDTSASDKLYADRQAQLAQRREADMARITAEYDTNKSVAETRQKKELEPIEKRLQLLKDTPYGDNAAVEEQLKQQLFGLQEAHKQEMDLLYNKRESSLASARTAYEDSDFKLAEMQMKNAKDAEDNIYKRQQDFINLALNVTQENRLQQQSDYNMMKDNKDFVINNGITAPLYYLGGQVFNSMTGQVEDPAKVDWTQVQVVDPGSKAEKDYVKDLAVKYPDAKISLTDTAEVAQAKLTSSKIYKEQVRPPQGQGASSVGTTAMNRYNLPSYVSEKEYNTVRNYIISNKASNPNMSPYELWDQLARGLEEQKINPTIYDGLFWEYLAPVKGQKTGYDQWAEKVGKDIKTNSMPIWMQVPGATPS